MSFRAHNLGVTDGLDISDIETRDGMPSQVEEIDAWLPEHSSAPRISP